MKKSLITIEHTNNTFENKFLFFAEKEYESYLNIINDDKTIEKVMNFSENELDEEVWRNISEFMPIEYKRYLKEGSNNLKLYKYKNYYVSNLGRIARIQDDNNLYLLKIINYKNNYSLISFGRTTFTIHKIVGFIFISNDDIKNKNCINHKELNQKYNNRSTFLEWSDRSHKLNNCNTKKKKEKLF